MRIKDDFKRKAIIESTIDIVYEKGFAGIKMSKLAKQVGISVSTLYVYFKSKEDLVLGVYKEITSNISKQSNSVIDPGLSIKLRLKSLWLFWINYAVQNSKEYSFFKQLKQSPYSYLITSETKQVNQQIALNLLALGKKEGVIKAIDSYKLLEIMHAIVMKVVELLIIQKIELNKKEMDTWYSFFWDAIKK